jgi:glycosyltransferase involved in cell wall biosynthesis
VSSKRPSDTGFPALRDIHLVLFMTEGMSLAAWDQVGMFDRETALYRRLRPHLAGITIVSYGDGQERAYRDRLLGIRIICNRGLSAERYRAWLRRHLPSRWHQPVIVKTNQTAGADLARQVAAGAGGWFIARCGYWLSDFMAREHGEDSSQAEQARALERRSYGTASRCIVTTAQAREALLAMDVPTGRINILPNYVDTDLFVPATMPSPVHPPRIVFIGRLAPQKNPDVVVKAARMTGMGLDMVGDGILKEGLRRLALDHPVIFHGNLPHRMLPDLIRDAFCFVLPSSYEGHPKALLEAMACGVPIVAARRPGIDTLIQDEVTGLLVEPDAADVAAAINRLRADPVLGARLGRAARDHVCRHFSLDDYLGKELAIYQDMITSAPRLTLQEAF